MARGLPSYRRVCLLCVLSLVLCFMVHAGGPDTHPGVATGADAARSARNQVPAATASTTPDDNGYGA